MQQAAVQGVALHLLQHDGPRSRLAIDLEVDDFVGAERTQRLLDGLCLSLDGDGLEAVTEDVAGQEALASQLRDLLTQDLPGLDRNFLASHLLPSEVVCQLRERPKIQPARRRAKKYPNPKAKAAGMVITALTLPLTLGANRTATLLSSTLT